MKKIIIRAVIASTFVVLAFLNFQINTKSTAHKDTSLTLQKAEAQVMCVEYYMDLLMCCGNPGTTCPTGWGINLNGPWYQY